MTSKRDNLKSLRCSKCGFVHSDMTVRICDKCKQAFTSEWHDENRLCLECRKEASFNPTKLRRKEK